MNIYVYKFGGASVNSAEGVKNVENIINSYYSKDSKLMIIISAMGKTTNKLECIVNKWYNDHIFDSETYNDLINYHNTIINDLFEENIIKTQIEELYKDLQQTIINNTIKDYDFLYDSIVSYGERLCTLIVSAYLNYKHINNLLVSAKDIIKTDSNYRDANVDWEKTDKNINNVIQKFNEYNIIITQGFIGGDKDNNFTTLGREGSDYSASIFANCMNAKSLIVWKDVPGMLNADPKRIENTVHLISLPYQEAIELSFYGASVIHPKTIRPLSLKNIPLYIKSFVNPSLKGTEISDCASVNPIVPNYIFKDEQVLLSIYPKDLSFLTNKSLREIFDILSQHKIHVNLMQNSAINFSICFNNNVNILKDLVCSLDKTFITRINTDLQLITIRHYTIDSINKVIASKKILIEQKNRITAQFLVQ